MITSPKYSFIQFNPADPDTCCTGVNTVCLPVVFGTDLRFQVIGDAPAVLEVVRMNGDSISSNSGFVDNGNGYYSWSSPIDLTGLACDECFQLKIGTALSNCFIKKCDDCYTTILEYFNDEDYAEFLYCNTDFVNRVRLPLFLSKPKMSEDRVVYRKSGGGIKLTKSLLTKEYQVQTDFMVEPMHDALCVALAHDSINVYSSAYSGGISKSSEYNLPWDDDMCIAQADFKVAADPFAIRNNNCQDCEEPVPPPGCTAVAISGSPSLPDATQDTAYSYSFTVTGDGPFSIGSEVKPAWMSISISGNTVSFTGTPAAEDVGTGIAVSFSISNCDGANTTSFDDTMDVNEAVAPPEGIHFGATTFISGDALTEYERANLAGGDAGATVTIVFDNYINSNGGTLTVNGSSMTMGDTFDIVLDGSGTGSFRCDIDGISNPGSAILGHFTIQSVTAGSIGTPYNYQNSKAF